MNTDGASARANLRQWMARHHGHRHGFALVAPLLLLFTTTPTASRAEPSIAWVDSPVPGQSRIVEVQGLPVASLDILRTRPPTDPTWQRLLAVHVEPENPLHEIDLPAVAGNYAVRADRLTFTPFFPLTAGISYRAVLHPNAAPGSPPGGDKTLVARHAFRAIGNQSQTRVTAVHPRTNALPANLLKFYVQFSAPMSRGHIYDHVRLLDDAHRPVELPFLEINEELWSPDMTRVTLLLDPGRIKRGVRPLEDIGPALLAGRSYTLEIDPAWRDAQGQPLSSGFQKRFTVIEPDRTPPDPAAWRISPPPAGSRHPLVVDFDEPLDHALASRVIRVTGAGGREIAGRTTLESNDSRWSFVPDSPWTAGEHALRIVATLEDLAGNNPGKPFDVDLFERVQPRVTHAQWTRTFPIR